MKNLILFGARASFGSDNIKTPPLGIQLFKELVIFNPNGWGSIHNSIKKQFEDDFKLDMKSLA
jgi:hypothetical protein